MTPISPIIRLACKIASGLLFLLTIFSAYGGYINPNLWATPSLFTLGFPYLALLTAIVIIAWAIARRWIMTAAGVATLFICGGPLLTVCPMGHSRKASPQDTPQFKILTYNILHGEDVEQHNENMNRSFQYLLDSGADIIVLQELYNFSKNEIKVLPKELRDSLFATYPYRVTDGYNDLCLLSKYPARILKVTDLPHGSNYFYEGYRINILGRKLTVLNVHLASYNLSEADRGVVDDMKSIGGAKKSLSSFKGSILGKMKKAFVNRDKHVSEIRDVIENIRGPLIICGDFNDVPASWAYRKMLGDDMKDAFTQTHFGPMITYNLHHFYFHIDQIMYRGDLKALSTERGSIRSSDHYPVIATFAFTPQ